MVEMRKRCPRCGGSRFAVTAHVSQEWEVDDEGNFVDCISDCLDIVHQPDDDDVWVCLKCGHDDAGSAFNRKITSEVKKAEALERMDAIVKSVGDPNLQNKFDEFMKA